MEKFALSEFVKSIDSSPTFEIDAQVKKLQQVGVKVYNLCLGEPDFFVPYNIKSAARRAILENKTKYTQVRGMSELIEAIRFKFKRDNNLTYGPAEVMVGNGAKEILYLAIRTVCEVGDELIVLAPYWVSYPEIAKLAGGVPVIVKTDNFRFSAEDVEKAITKRTKAIIINSPNNPTSIVWTRKELEGLARLALKYKILVISDEIYEKFLYGKARHFSFASLDPKLKDYTVTVNGVSKTYVMTGFRIGYCGAPDYIVQKMVELKSHVSSNACSVSQTAAIEALLGNQEHWQKMVAEFNERRSFVCKEFKKFGVEFVKPKGAYYVFFKVKPKFDSLDFCKTMLNDFQVALNPGESFGIPGWVRLSYTVGMADLEEGVGRIIKLFKCRS